VSPILAAATRHLVQRSGEVTGSNSSLSLAINAETTQSNVQVCTELDVFGGQQGSLKIIAVQANWLYNNLK
jgi:hypothetical protein